MIAKVVAVGAAGAAVFFVVAISSVTGDAPPRASAADSSCAPASGSTVTVTASELDATQLGNAATIVSVGRSIPGVGVKGEIIAVATALVEPIPPLTNDLVDTDHLSHGIFQQQAPGFGWGTVAQTENVRFASTSFYDHLLAVPAFKTLPVEGASGWAAAWGAVAQDVQRSGFPLRYQAQIPLAAQLAGTAKAAGPVMLDNCTITSAPPLAAGSKLPAAVVAQIDRAPAAVRIAIKFALSKRGLPYQWGGTGDPSYDCSGLTQAAYAAAGVSIARDTFGQVKDGAPVAQDALRSGDLLEPDPGHVQLVLGRDVKGVLWIVEAPSTGLKIRSVPAWGYWAARRIISA